MRYRDIQVTGPAGRTTDPHSSHISLILRYRAMSGSDFTTSTAINASATDAVTRTIILLPPFPRVAPLGRRARGRGPPRWPPPRPPAGRDPSLRRAWRAGNPRRRSDAGRRPAG